MLRGISKGVQKVSARFMWPVLAVKWLPCGGCSCSPVIGTRIGLTDYHLWVVYDEVCTTLTIPLRI